MILLIASDRVLDVNGAIVCLENADGDIDYKPVRLYWDYNKAMEHGAPKGRRTAKLVCNFWGSRRILDYQNKDGMALYADSRAA